MKIKYLIYLFIMFVVPAIIVALSWILLYPIGFWQKLIMVIVSIVEYLVLLWACIQIVEAIDR